MNEEAKKQDIKIRERFIREFDHMIKYYQFMQPLDSHDVSWTGTTGNIYHFELKERYYYIDQLAYDCYFEQAKFNHFKILYRLNPKDHLIYFSYCADGTLSFNIGARFAAKSSDLQLITTLVPLNNYDKNSILVEKLVCHLRFSPELGDKIQRIDVNKRIKQLMNK